MLKRILLWLRIRYIQWDWKRKKQVWGANLPTLVCLAQLVNSPLLLRYNPKVQGLYVFRNSYLHIGELHESMRVFAKIAENLEDAKVELFPRSMFEAQQNRIMDYYLVDGRNTAISPTLAAEFLVLYLLKIHTAMETLDKNSIRYKYYMRRIKPLLENVYYLLEALLKVALV